MALAMLPLLLLGVLPSGVQAGKIVLRIQAGNPREDQEQTVQIKTALPAGVHTNDVLSLAGLELGYDVKLDQYYVHRDVKLGPKQIAIYDVEINDVWTIPDAELVTLREHTGRLVDRLQGHLEPKQIEQSVQPLQAGILENLSRISQTQRDNAIGPGVQPLQHIRAHASNLERLKRVKLDVGHLENLVLGTGQDPGGMFGDDRRSPKPERFLDAESTANKTAVFRVTVENTSPNRKRTVPVRQDLPEEIREHDVIDTGGLDLGTDKERGVAYVYKQNLELEPKEQRTFNVIIRDKWNVGGPRIEALNRSAADLLKRVAAKEKFTSVEEALRGLVTDLDRVSQENGPDTVDSSYVAFHRNQATELDEIETRLNRIVMALPPLERTTQIGFKVKPPSPRTTWLIIYIILGFLAILSVIFYFRWYGKSRAEGDGGLPGDR
ncbi:MAG: hypothetical protein K8T26_02850 [Lentisphaerae bacterium]|nr:hypothetical protein [Lentisphaerota bacterium]